MSAKPTSKSVSPYKKGKINNGDRDRFCQQVCNTKFKQISAELEKSMSALALELLTLTKLPVSDEALNTMIEHQAVYPIKGVRVYYKNRQHRRAMSEPEGFIWDYEHLVASEGVVVSQTLLQKVQSNPSYSNGVDARFSPELAAKVDYILNAFEKNRNDRRDLTNQLQHIVATLGSWAKVAEHIPEASKWIPLADGFTHQPLMPVDTVESINNIREGLKGLTDVQA